MADHRIFASRELLANPETITSFCSEAADIHGFLLLILYYVLANDSLGTILVVCNDRSVLD